MDGKQSKWMIDLKLTKIWFTESIKHLKEESQELSAEKINVKKIVETLETGFNKLFDIYKHWNEGEHAEERKKTVFNFTAGPPLTNKDIGQMRNLSSVSVPVNHVTIKTIHSPLNDYSCKF